MAVSTPVFVANFDRFLAAFEKYCPFNRPEQVDGHRSVIARRRELGSAIAAIQDQRFVGDLYRTLRAWGLGSRASHLVSLASFGTALHAAKARIAPFESRTLEDASRDPQAMADLWSLISTLGIVDNKAPLVAGTKALHHILPDLVVPMDRAYTQVFFAWQNPTFQYHQEDCFLEAYRVFGEVARAVGLSRHVGTSAWSTSTTKVVDNAVIGAVCSFKEDAIQQPEASVAGPAMPQTTQARKHTTGMAGEFLVAGELLRRGVMAAVTYGNAKKADVIAFHDSRSVPIEVKSTSEQKWVLGGSLPQVDAGLWVLVHLPPDVREAPEYFVLTGAELRKAVAPRHEAYMASYLAKHGKEYVGVGVVSVLRKELDDHHLGAWDKILRALGMS